MLEDFQEKQRQQGTRMRSVMDYTMGIVFFFLGLFFIFYRHFGIRIMAREPSNLDFVIGGLFVAYGSWRFYRGYKKNYYR
jgi:hypothetical protein